MKRLVGAAAGHPLYPPSSHFYKENVNTNTPLVFFKRGWIGYIDGCRACHATRVISQFSRLRDRRGGAPKWRLMVE